MIDFTFHIIVACVLGATRNDVNVLLPIKVARHHDDGHGHAAPDCYIACAHDLALNPR